MVKIAGRGQSIKGGLINWESLFMSSEKYLNFNASREDVPGVTHGQRRITKETDDFDRRVDRKDTGDGEMGAPLSHSNLPKKTPLRKSLSALRPTNQDQA